MESSPEKADLSRIENAEASKLDTTQHIANGEVLLIAPDKHVRQIPVPTTDPNDPLNWARWRKFGLIANCCWFGMLLLQKYILIRQDCTLTEDLGNTLSHLLASLCERCWHFHGDFV